MGHQPGDSQSGNFIRSYIHLGFNQDEAGAHGVGWRQSAYRRAAAGAQLPLRGRRRHAARIEPGSEGVLWWSDYPDTARHRPTAGLLDRCRATNTCPEDFRHLRRLEFWFLRESPDLVGTDAKSDIPLPPNVRRYFFPDDAWRRTGRIQHCGPRRPRLRAAANPNPESDTMKALTVALIDWVTKGTEPPPSRYPRSSATTRARHQTAIGFPNIPGVPSPDGVVNPVFDYDFGPDFNYNDLPA